MNKIEQFNQKYSMKEIPQIQPSKGTLPHGALRPGWTVKIFQKIKEGGKERTASFEGIVIANKHGRETGGTVTLRKIISGVGVEKIFPLHSPTIEKIEILKKAKVRRSKLYYLRYKSKKEIRRKIKAI
ncbi:MAG: 50S ribosomal protein L19 [Patescibacteria group bacterium]